MGMFSETYSLEAKQPLRERFPLMEHLIRNSAFLNLAKMWVRQVTDGKSLRMSSNAWLASYCDSCDDTHVRNPVRTFPVIQETLPFLLPSFIIRPRFIAALHCNLTALVEQSHLELTRNMYLNSHLLPISMTRLDTPPAQCSCLGQLGLEASAVDTCIRSLPALEVPSTSPRFLLCRPLMIHT